MLKVFLVQCLEKCVSSVEEQLWSRRRDSCANKRSWCLLNITTPEHLSLMMMIFIGSRYYIVYSLNTLKI